MKPSKCAACRPHDPFNSEFVVDTGLVVLGSPAVDGGEMPLGAPMWDESNLANDSTTGRADKACKLAKGITGMARATVDKCRVQAATVLLQRVVCPSQARANKHDAVFQSLVAIARRELEPEQQCRCMKPTLAVLLRKKSTISIGRETKHTFYKRKSHFFVC